MLTVCGQQHSFWTHNEMFLRKCHRSFWVRKCLHWGRSWTQTFGFMPNALPFELQGPGISYPMFWSNGFGGTDIFVFFCEIDISMLFSVGNSINFQLRNGSSWESVEIFETQNVSIQVGFMPNALPLELLQYKLIQTIISVLIRHLGSAELSFLSTPLNLTELDGSNNILNSYLIIYIYHICASCMLSIHMWLH